jgi:hypothetical protein
VADAGIVDENVEVTCRRENLTGYVGALRFIGDVECQKHRGVCGRVQTFNQRPPRCFIAVGHENVRPGTGKSLRDGGADP